MNNLSANFSLESEKYFIKYMMNILLCRSLNLKGGIYEDKCYRFDR